jgi:hypothetical protein
MGRLHVSLTACSEPELRRTAQADGAVQGKGVRGEKDSTELSYLVSCGTTSAMFLLSRLVSEGRDEPSACRIRDMERSASIVFTQTRCKP